MNKLPTYKAYLLFLPFLCIDLFLVFYIIAAVKYPGGSYADPTNEGFSILNNYLCDLLDNQAIIGVENAASTYARISLAFLCLSIIIIWAILPKLFSIKSIFHPIIQIAGISSMLVTVLLRDGMHDPILRIAGLLGSIALIATFIELYKNEYFKLLAAGIICMTLVATNFYIYETGYFILQLPIIQKITFACCIGWFLTMMLLIIFKMQNEVLENNEKTMKS